MASTIDVIAPHGYHYVYVKSFRKNGKLYVAAAYGKQAFRLKIKD
jgi:hypothetical protein